MIQKNLLEQRVKEKVFGPIGFGFSAQNLFLIRYMSNRPKIRPSKKTAVLIFVLFSSFMSIECQACLECGDLSHIGDSFPMEVDNGAISQCGTNYFQTLPISVAQYAFASFLQLRDLGQINNSSRLMGKIVKGSIPFIKAIKLSKDMDWLMEHLVGAASMPNIVKLNKTWIREIKHYFRSVLNETHFADQG